ncbi:MAG: hypothetical protein JWO47_220 [Candidatus Saccharibacteria bacterium]|nr:hypothetical protein [Candidatus Saccharibacteria bacterium]
MSLTTSDLQEIRSIFESAFTRQNDENIKSILSEIQALRNDIKDIYEMISELEKNTTDSKFSKLSLENKILTLNSKLIIAAKQAGITLPR